jgi:hypothetical protein
VADVINTLFVATDSRDWKRVRSCLAPTVTFDMTSLIGGEARQMSPEQIASGWESGLALSCSPPCPTATSCSPSRACCARYSAAGVSY